MESSIFWAVPGWGSMGECPFRTGKNWYSSFLEKADFILIDFHAEDPLEKEALAFYLDGSVSIIYGTHTHIQTADERIFPAGTGFITEIGMVGPAHSVIGSDPEQS